MRKIRNKNLNASMMELTDMILLSGIALNECAGLNPARGTMPD